MFYQWQRRDGLIYSGRVFIEEKGEDLERSQLKGSLGMFRISLVGGNIKRLIVKIRAKSKAL